MPFFITYIQLNTVYKDKILVFLSIQFNCIQMITLCFIYVLHSVPVPTSPEMGSISTLAVHFPENYEM